jgi:hypothetical protein
MVLERVRTPNTIPTPSTIPTAVSRVRCTLARRFRKLRPEKRLSFTLPRPSALDVRLEHLDTFQDLVLVRVPCLIDHPAVREEDGPVGRRRGARVVGDH